MHCALSRMHNPQLWLIFMSTNATSRPTRIRVGLLILLALLTALDAIAIDMYLPAMPAIADSFAVDAGRIQHTLSVFLAGLAIGQALYGPLLDRYGRRAPLIVGMLLFIVGSVASALSTSPEMLMLARFVQALGAAAGLVTPRAIVSDMCSMTESSKIYSVLMQVMMIAPILAPVTGSMVLQAGSWQAIFWLLSLFGVIALLWCLCGVPETLSPQARTWLDVRTLWRVYAGLLTQRNFMAFTLAGGFILVSLFTWISASSFILTGTFSLSPTTFSYLFAMNAIMLIVGGFLSNLLLKNGHTEMALTRAGIAVHILAGCVLFIAALASAASLPLFVAAIAIGMGALGLVFGNLTALTMQQAKHQAGVASSIMGALQYLLSSVIGFAYSKWSVGLESLPLALALCGAIALICISITKNKRRG